MKLFKNQKFYFSSKLNFNLMNDPYGDKEINFSVQNDFLIDLTKKNFDVFKNSEEINDPNLGDQLCHLRAIWYLEILNRQKYNGTLSKLDMIHLGKSILINRFLKYDINDFGMMDKYIDIKKEEFEELVQQQLSNKRKEKYSVNMKSIFSRYVNNFFSETIIPKLGFSKEIQTDILNHFSNKLYFVQKHEKIPFVPFYSSGVVFIDYILKINPKIFVLYRHFVVEKDHIYLNGYKYIEFKDGNLCLSNENNNLDENAIVIESYSCYFADKTNNAYDTNFYKSKNFDKVLRNMVKEMNLKDFILSNFAYHDPYHQQPFFKQNNKETKYVFNDFSDPLNSQIEYYKKMAVKNGLGLNQWFPYKGIYLNDDIAFNLFHIYPKNMRKFSEDLEMNKKYLHTKFPLYSSKNYIKSDKYY